MTGASPTILLLWIPFVAAAFYLMAPRTAATVSLLLAWLFLPVAQLEIPGLPDIDKMSVACGAILLSALLFDSRRVLSLPLRAGIADVPMLLWCLAPLATAISNYPELTFYDGLSDVSRSLAVLGLPYLLGRLYFSDSEGLRKLAIAVFVGGLLYAPLCLFEARFSPQLHRIVYGYHQHDFGQSIREGSYRPMVFLQHGLAVALFMAAATLSGLWLWRTGGLRRVLGLPIWLVLPPLAATTVLCRSTGATLLMFMGAALLIFTSWLRSYALVAILAVLPIVYVSVRIVTSWEGEQLVEAAEAVANPARAQSLQFRLQNEVLMIRHIAERPLFGWGGYNRSYVLDSYGRIQSVPDSMWIITYGQQGLLGLAAALLLLMPPLAALYRLPTVTWRLPQYAGVAVFMVLAILFAIDNLVNNMPNPLFLVGIGGLSGMLYAAAPRLLAVPADPRLLPQTHVPVTGAVRGRRHLTESPARKLIVSQPAALPSVS